MRPKLSDVLTAELRSEIRQGKYGSDGRLPSENELSQRFGVSRPIVRDALKELREEGLIHSRQGAGSFVHREDNGQAAKLLLKEGATPVHSIAEVRKIYDYRIALEGEIAAAAATNARPEHIRDIKAKLDAIHTSIKEGTPGVEQDFDFHVSIAQATGNDLFESALALIRPHLGFVIDLARSFSSLGTAAHVEMVQEEHARVYQAIAEADSGRARIAMQNHIVAARNRVFFGVHLSPSEAAMGRLVD